MFSWFKKLISSRLQMRILQTFASLKQQGIDGFDSTGYSGDDELLSRIEEVPDRVEEYG